MYQWGYLIHKLQKSYYHKYMGKRYITFYDQKYLGTYILIQQLFVPWSKLTMDFSCFSKNVDNIPLEYLEKETPLLIKFKLFL